MKTLWQKRKLLILLLPKCFQNSSAADASENVYMWEKVNPILIYTISSADSFKTPSQKYGKSLPHRGYILLQIILITFNLFPHIDAFWHLCSRQLFENIVTKEEIAQNEQFLLIMFSTFSHIRLSIQLKRFSIFWQNMFKVFCCKHAVWGKGLI